MTASEYIAALGGSQPKLIVVEDNEELRKTCGASLQQAGFDVMPGKFAAELPQLLAKWPGVNAIPSDTETGESSSDEVVRKLLDQVQTDDSVLILGMSDDEAIQDCRAGIAHHAGFYNKHRFHEDMGCQIMSHYYNFATSQSPLWRERSRRCDDREWQESSPITRQPTAKQ